MSETSGSPLANSTGGIVLSPRIFLAERQEGYWIGSRGNDGKRPSVGDYLAQPILYLVHESTFITRKR